MREIKLLLLFVVLFISSEFYCQDTTLVPTQKLTISKGCYEANVNGVMTTEEEFKKNVVETRDAKHMPTCKTFCLPEFNFKQYNLIWINLYEGPVWLEKTVLYKIKSQKKYVFVVTLLADAVDTRAVGIFIQVSELTPKFEKDYTFEYKVVHDCYYYNKPQLMEVYTPNRNMKCIYPMPKGK